MGPLDKFLHGRPHRGLARPLTTLVHCPLCIAGGAAPSEIEFDDYGDEIHTDPDVPLRIVGYRPNGVRFECQICALRFSVPLSGEYGLRATLEKLSDKVSLRARDVSNVLEVAAAARLEERLRHEGSEDVPRHLESEALKHVIHRLRRAEDGLKKSTSADSRTLRQGRGS